MSEINLTDTRWRWRRNNAPTEIGTMLDLAPGANPSGTFTDTLLKFEAQSLNLPPEAAPLFPQGIPDPALGMWYKGTVEECDKHHNDLDNDPTLGTFWAKLWSPTPPPTTPSHATSIAKLTILLFQYRFAVPDIIPINHSGVRIFVGNLWEHVNGHVNDGPTFYGSGFDNWAGHTHYTFTLTQEAWPQI
jgi:hypothetical protein